MTPFVVDANAIHCFQEERIREQPGSAHEAMAAISVQHCIAIDTEKLCLQEWIECAGGKFPFSLADWVGDEVVAGRIKFFALAPNGCRKDLLKAGLPQKDHKWVRLAVGCGGKRLVSGDIDFFDPRQKKASAAVKQKLKDARSGPCAKHLSKVYGIRVMCLEHVPGEVEAL